MSTIFHCFPMNFYCYTIILHCFHNVTYANIITKG
nr:MAG TPA: hypothetical protein [Caudoviricetes sp.]